MNDITDTLEPPATPGDIRAYDVRTGKTRWTFHTIPRPVQWPHSPKRRSSPLTGMSQRSTRSRMPRCSAKPNSSISVMCRMVAKGEQSSLGYSVFTPGTELTPVCHEAEEVDEEERPHRRALGLLDGGIDLLERQAALLLGAIQVENQARI